MDLKSLTKGSSYNFSAWASAIWPDVKGAVYDGDLGYTTASSIEAVASKHAAAYAYLPAGTPKDPHKLNYLVFLINGTAKVMAYEWINPATLVGETITTRTYTVAGASAADDQRIIRLLAGGGYVVGAIS